MGIDPIFIGIDVSKARLDVSVRPLDHRESVANDEVGIMALVKRLREMQPALIVLEATGGVERQVVRALASEELAVVVVNPRQVRDFAKATGQLAKTDSIDAEVLARFGEAVRPALRPLADAGSEELRARVARRRQITEMIVAKETGQVELLRVFENALTLTFAGWRQNLSVPMKIWTKASVKVRSGVRKRTCLRVSLASVLWSAAPCWQSCLSSGDSTVNRSLPWWVWRRSIGIAGRFEAVALFGGTGYGACGAVHGCVGRQQT